MYHRPFRHLPGSDDCVLFKRPTRAEHEVSSYSTIVPGSRSISHLSRSFRCGAALFSPCTVDELLDAYDDGDLDEAPYTPGVDDLLPWGVSTSDGQSVTGPHVLERHIEPHASIELTRGRPIFAMNKVPAVLPLSFICLAW
jgi:hypothetical protein